MAKTAELEIDVRDEILEYLESIERTLAWLSRGTKIKYSTLYAIFVHKITRLSEDKLSKINAFLGKNFRPQP